MGKVGGEGFREGDGGDGVKDDEAVAEEAGASLTHVLITTSAAAHSAGEGEEERGGGGEGVEVEVEGDGDGGDDLPVSARS